MRSGRWLSVLVLFLTIEAWAQENSDQKGQGGEISRWELNPFTGGFSNLGTSFTGYNLVYHGLAFGITPVLIYTGIDENGRAHFDGRSNPVFGYRATRIYLHAGDYYQVATALILYGIGHWYNDPYHLGGGSALLQAVVLTGFYVSSLKLLSGRPRPGPDLDRDFSPFNLKRNISEKRARWPSGHTASAFAFASSLTAYYADLWYVKYLVYPFAASMGLAMIEGDFHWTSDVIAGALMGQVIGWVVGSSFRQRYNSLQKGSAHLNRQGYSLAFTPVLSPGLSGLKAVLSL